MSIEFVGNLEEALSRFPGQVDQAARAAVKETAQELHKKVVRRTPQFTGRARAGWRVEVKGLDASVRNTRVVAPGEPTPKKKRRRSRKEKDDKRLARLARRQKSRRKKGSGGGGPVPILQVLEKEGGVGNRYKPGIMRRSARTERKKFRRRMTVSLSKILGKEPPKRKRPRRWNQPPRQKRA